MCRTADIPVIILFGPTASGKTAILLHLFANSPVFQAEIVSADSMQVYRGMDIGTAKPGADERARLAHHLIDIRNPDEQFNAGDFVHLAEEACLDIYSRGKIPVVSGGTGFYIRNFICGLPEAPPSDPRIRAQLRRELDEWGINSLRAELEASDPVSAGRIHINDTYRLLRALEVRRLTGKPLSSFAVTGQGRQGMPPFKFLVIALSRPRAELYRRIDMRCQAMFDQGLRDEVSRLFKAGYTPADPGMRAIGYREFFLEDTVSDSTPDSSPDSNRAPGHGTAAYRLSTDIEDVKARVSRNSRRYAKRQLTFFAQIPGVTWVDAGSDEAETAALIREKIAEFLSKNFTNAAT